MIALFGTVLQAHAAIYNVTFCAEYKTDFEDADMSLYGWEEDTDYWEDNQNRPARGARVRAKYVAGGATYTFSAYSDWTGPNAGCVTFPLNSGFSYDVFIDSLAIVDGHAVKVFKTPGGTTYWTSKALDDWTPSASSTVDIETYNTHRAWDVASVVGYALSRRDAGTGTEKMVVFTDNTGGGSPYYSVGDKAIRFPYPSGSHRHRFITAHELGHWVADLNNNGGAGWTQSYAETGPECTSGSTNHNIVSKEHASAAAVEGFADYHAVVTFNDTSENDCSYVNHGLFDIDRSGSVNVSSYEKVPKNLNCEGEILWDDSSDPMIGNYLEYYCDSPLEDRGVQYDWLRFFWALDTDRGLSFGAIVDFWDSMNPHLWNAMGVSGTTHLHDVRNHIDIGAFAEGIETEVDNEKILKGIYQ